MTSPTIRNLAGRVRSLMLDHPDIESVRIEYVDLNRYVRFTATPTDQRTSEEFLFGYLHYDEAPKMAWKDIESKFIRDMNKWFRDRDIKVGNPFPMDSQPAPLPNEMRYQKLLETADDSPEDRFGPYTPEAIAEAKQTAKDRLWGAPTDHPVVMSLRHQYRDAMVNILLNTKPSRRQSLALSDLEQSLMWAIKTVFEKEN